MRGAVDAMHRGRFAAVLAALVLAGCDVPQTRTVFVVHRSAFAGQEDQSIAEGFSTWLKPFGIECEEFARVEESVLDCRETSGKNTYAAVKLAFSADALEFRVETVRAVPIWREISQVHRNGELLVLDFLEGRRIERSYFTIDGSEERPFHPPP